MNYFGVDEEGIECHIGDVLARSSDYVDVYDSTAAEAEEGIECFHIGDIFARTSDADSITDEEASTAAPAAGRNQNSSKKKLIYIGAAVSTVFIAIATGVLVSRQSSTQKRVASASLTEETAEIPWYACLDKESCFRQASLLGFTEEDRRSGDYADTNLYGCFFKDLLAYWGEGGTEEQMVTTEFPGVKQRIWCYDVNPNPEEELDICGNPIPNLPSGTPSVTPSTFRPSMSSQPSLNPTSSLRPSLSTKPSASPTSSEPSASPTSSEPSSSPTSSEPSASPSLSSQPSTSSHPSDVPSISSNPSTSPSGQPSSSPSR